MTPTVTIFTSILTLRKWKRDGTRGSPMFIVMRSFLVLIMLSSAANAWDFSPSPVCTLSHETPAVSLAVTYDPRLSEPYAISITPSATWSDASMFALRFDGPRGMTITTDRHSIEGSTLTVRDRGFGNVLNGLDFNNTATASLGETSLTVSLDGASEPIAAFRACLIAPVA